MKRTVVIICLPMEMGAMGRIMAAVAAEFPEATVAPGDDGNTLHVEADDGGVLEPRKSQADYA